MIRVTFDPYYVDDLQDYYRRNECIREQQYLSTEKLLHLAAFCVTRAAEDIDDGKEQHGNGPNREVAVDVVRQLSALCENAGLAQVQLEPVTTVIGRTHQEIRDEEVRATAMASKVVARDTIGLMRLQSFVSSAINCSFGWLNSLRIGAYLVSLCFAPKR
jgi:hypothetical protein